VPSCLLEPAWVEFESLLNASRGGQPPEFVPGHPLGCHRRRIPDRVVFEHVISALVHGSGYERIATPGCSDRTIRRRLAQWAAWGLASQLHAAALAAHDRVIGLELADIAVDGCLTKAPCGGEKVGPSPVDRRKGGLKRSTATGQRGIPLGIASAGASRHDLPLLEPTLHAMLAQASPVPAGARVHLDAAYHCDRARDLVTSLRFRAQIARPGLPAPVQASHRWPVERTNAWMNGYGKLRRCTERSGQVIDFYLYLAAALITIRQLIQRARTLYRWDTRPATKRLK
jgi:hypothetical protein